MLIVRSIIARDLPQVMLHVKAVSLWIFRGWEVQEGLVVAVRILCATMMEKVWGN